MLGLVGVAEGHGMCIAMVSERLEGDEGVVGSGVEGGPRQCRFWICYLRVAWEG